MPAPIVAIVPAFREAPRVGGVVLGAAAHLPVVVIDDGSDDGTAEAAAAAGATVLRQVANQGKGAALRAGFRHALESGADAVVTLDADGQHDPAEIPGFVATFRGDGHGSGDGTGRPDLVVGARDFSRMPPVRRLSNTVGRWAFSWAVGRPIPDNQSGYRLLSRRLMTAMLESDESGFAFEVEMLARCVREDWPIAWVPIRTIYAGAPSSIRPVAHVREFFGMVRRARAMVRGDRR